MNIVDIIHEYRYEIIFLIGVAVPFILAKSFVTKADMEKTNRRIYKIEASIAVFSERFKNFPNYRDVQELREEITRLGVLTRELKIVNARLERIEKCVLEKEV